MPKKTTGAGASGGSTPAWTPDSLPSIAAWGDGRSIDPQSAATLTAWNAAGGAPNLSTINGTPAVAARGSTYACEFTRASSQRAINGSATITKASSGAIWIVFRMRAGFSSGVAHGLLTLGSTGSSTRRLELAAQNISGTLYPTFRVFETGSNTRTVVRTTGLSDTNWHSMLFEYTGSAHRLSWDESLLTGGDVTNTTAGTAPNWLADWHASITPNTAGLACVVVNAAPVDHGDIHVQAWGWTAAPLGAEESNLLTYLQTQRTLA